MRNEPAPTHVVMWEEYPDGNTEEHSRVFWSILEATMFAATRESRVFGVFGEYEFSVTWKLKERT